MRLFNENPTLSKTISVSDVLKFRNHYAVFAQVGHGEYRLFCVQRSFITSNIFLNRLGKTTYVKNVNDVSVDELLNLTSNTKVKDWSVTNLKLSDIFFGLQKDLNTSM